MKKFSLSLNIRAENLLQALDIRYNRWVDQLPSFFKELAIAESTFTGRSGEELFQVSTSLNPLNARSPWLFWDLFQELENEKFLNIAEAGAFISLSTVVLDHLVDQQSVNPALTTLFQGKLYQHGHSTFQEIFPNNSNFWESFHRYETDYYWALGVEVEAQTNPTIFTDETFVQSAKFKASPMLITIAALTEASGLSNLLEYIERSIQFCAVAGQLHDDILDCAPDLDNGHITRVLLQLLQGTEWKNDKRMPIEGLQSIIDKEWIDLVIFKEVIHWFDEAKQAVDGLNCPGWMRYLEEYQKIASGHQMACAANHLIHEFLPVVSGNIPNDK